MDAMSATAAVITADMELIVKALRHATASTALTPEEGKRAERMIDAYQGLLDNPGALRVARELARDQRPKLEIVEATECLRDDV